MWALDCQIPSFLNLLFCRPPRRVSAETVKSRCPWELHISVPLSPGWRRVPLSLQLRGFQSQTHCLFILHRFHEQSSPCLKWITNSCVQCSLFFILFMYLVSYIFRMGALLEADKLWLLFPAPSLTNHVAESEALLSEASLSLSFPKIYQD